MSRSFEGKIPLYVTLLFAAAGWTITHFVDRVVSSPAIEYQLIIAPTVDGQKKYQANVLITNLSRTATHEQVLIRLRKDPGRPNIRFAKDTCEIVAVPPTSLGKQEGTPDCDEQVAEFKAQILPPQGQAKLVVHFSGEGNVIVQGGPSEPGKGSYYFAPRSFETWLVRWEFTVLFSGLGIWAILLFMSGCYSRNSTKETHEP